MGVRYSKNLNGLGDVCLPNTELNRARTQTNAYLLNIDGYLFDGSSGSEIGARYNDPVLDHLVNTGAKVIFVGPNEDIPQVEFYCKHTNGVDAKSEGFVSYGDEYWSLPVNWIHLNREQQNYLKAKPTFNYTRVEHAEIKWSKHGQPCDSFDLAALDFSKFVSLLWYN